MAREYNREMVDIAVYFSSWAFVHSSELNCGSRASMAIGAGKDA